MDAQKAQRCVETYSNKCAATTERNSDPWAYMKEHEAEKFSQINRTTTRESARIPNNETTSLLHEKNCVRCAASVKNMILVFGAKANLFFLSAAHKH